MYPSCCVMYMSTACVSILLSYVHEYSMRIHLVELCTASMLVIELIVVCVFMI